MLMFEIRNDVRNVDVRNCCKLSLYAISRKAHEPNLRKWQKTSHSLDIMVSYHQVPYQKKLMIQYRENLVTDERTDGQTHESDFIEHCLTYSAQ